jgi:S1-C subfamily serine protease
MRLGLHITEQKKIIRSLRTILNNQILVMVALGIFALAVLAAFAFAPQKYVPPAVAIVQSDAGIGSGFLINNGLILTTASIVWNSQDVQVSFPDQSPLLASVIVCDAKSDVALLQASSSVDSSLIPFSLGDAERVSNGDSVRILGYPGGLLLESSGRIERTSAEEIITSFDALDPGYTGGPLVLEADGTVVGILRMSDNQGAGGRLAAIPINMVKQVCRNYNRPID